MKERLKNIYNKFTSYEKIWFLSVIVLVILVATLFPGTIDELEINPVVIMGLYILDVLTNALCELLISKQSKWNFIVSLLVEVIEIAICIVTMERFATMATTFFFWIPIDIISFINWNKHPDEKDDDLTIVRSLKGYQEVLIILGIIAWTVGIGYLLTVIEPDGILESDTVAKKVVCYLDAFASSVGICNGLFILFRIREQWIAWYIEAICETIMNIILGQWVLLVLKAAYFSNTTYGYIKWTKYIRNKNENLSVK